MPALPAIPKVVRLDLHFSEASDPNIQIREFFQYSGALSTTDATTWLSNIVTAMGTFVGVSMYPPISLVLSVLTDLTSATAPQIQNSTGYAASGGPGKLSAGTALVIRKHIARRYRGGHPRVYLPGMTSGGLSTPSQWDPTFLGGVVGYYTSFINACVANTNPAAIGTITHVNVSYFQGFTNHTYPSGRVKPIPTPRAVPLVDTITALVGNPKPGSQRRRNLQS